MGKPSFVPLPSLLNIRSVVVMGGFGQEDSVVRDEVKRLVHDVRRAPLLYSDHPNC